MVRDRKAALAASIQAERAATQGRVPRFDKFEKAEAALSGGELLAAARTGRSTTARPASVRALPLEKVTRDSFTMPSTDYEKIRLLRARCLKAGLSVTKSEIIRAGLHALERLSPEHLREVIASL